MQLHVCIQQLVFVFSLLIMTFPHWVRITWVRPLEKKYELWHLPFYAHGDWFMMTSSNGDIFGVIGLLCGEFTGPRWIPLTKASDAELWCFLWSAPEYTVVQTIVRLVIWDATVLIITSPWWSVISRFHERQAWCLNRQLTPPTSALASV